MQAPWEIPVQGANVSAHPCACPKLEEHTNCHIHDTMIDHQLSSMSGSCISSKIFPHQNKAAFNFLACREKLPSEFRRVERGGAIHKEGQELLCPGMQRLQPFIKASSRSEESRQNLFGEAW